MNLAGLAMKTGGLKTGIAAWSRKNDNCDHMKKNRDHRLRKHSGAGGSHSRGLRATSTILASLRAVS
jgi:hypothetical protein